MRAVVSDRLFVRVWLLQVVVYTLSFGMQEAGFPAYITRPGHLPVNVVGLAFAANTVTIVIAQLSVLKALRGRSRTGSMAAAVSLFALSWTIILASGQGGSGALPEVGVILAMAVFGLGETLLSPTF